MESVLGTTGISHKAKNKAKGSEINERRDSRHNVYEADALEELEERDAARQRYVRLYWESVSELGGVRSSLVGLCAALIVY